MQKIAKIFLFIFVFLNLSNVKADELFPIETNNRFGYIDQKGNIKILLSPNIKMSYPFSEGLAAFKLNDKYGFINTKGIVVIKPIFKEVSYFSEGLCAANYNEKWGYINTLGELAIKPQFDIMGSRFSEGLAQIIINKKGTGFINRLGKFVIPPKFHADPGMEIKFNCGLAKMQLNNKFGFIDKYGKWSINPIYDDAFSFNECVATVMINKKWGFIDQKGNWLIRPQFNFANFFSEGLASVMKDKKWLIINKNNKVVIDEKKLSNGIPGIFSNGLSSVNVGGAYGFINKSGEFVITPQYSLAYPFEDGLTYVFKEKYCGYINKIGNWIWKTTKCYSN
jgi:hypothetical protein